MVIPSTERLYTLGTLKHIGTADNETVKLEYYLQAPVELDSIAPYFDHLYLDLSFKALPFSPPPTIEDGVHIQFMYTSTYDDDEHQHVNSPFMVTFKQQTTIPGHVPITSIHDVVWYTPVAQDKRLINLLEYRPYQYTTGWYTFLVTTQYPLEMSISLIVSTSQPDPLPLTTDIGI